MRFALSRRTQKAQEPMVEFMEPKGVVRALISLVETREKTGHSLLAVKPG